MSGDDLSARLMAVADMVTPGMYVYDVGCDHAFLSIYLVSHRIAVGACASDVRPGPLAAAKEHVAAAGLDDRISVVLSDGLHNIAKSEQGKPAAIVIAGMGGPLILDILRAGSDIVSECDEVIISPQSRIEDVRAALPGMGLEITDETMVREDGKFYTVMKLRVSSGTSGAGDTEPDGADALLDTQDADIPAYIYDRYGRVLIERRDTVLSEYLEWEMGVLTGVASGLSETDHTDRYNEVQKLIQDNRLIYELIKGE